ncbi:MAG: extracellular solute-binding protein [Gammaproteobacteria bacterium]
MDAVDGASPSRSSPPNWRAIYLTQFRDPSGQWYGLTTRARVIVTSKERVPKDAVKRYEDLADPQWKGRVCTRSGKHVYNTALIASMIVHHGAAGGEQWLTGLKNNLARKPQGGDIDQVKAIQAGECDIALINHYYLGVMLKDSKLAAAAQTVNLIFPNQDERGTHVNISGIALTQSAPHKDNALKLMGFLSGDEAQRLYAELNSEFPVKPGVPWSDILKTWGEFKIDPLPLAEIAAHRKEAIELVDKVRYDD